MYVRNRTPPQNKFEFFERGWRVALAWICILLVIIPLCVCAAVIMVMFTLAFINAFRTGQPLPDVTAGLDRVLPSIMPYVAPAIGGLFALLLSRHREVNTQLGGGHNRVPFDPYSPPPSDSVPQVSEPNPNGALINNRAIE